MSRYRLRCEREWLACTKCELHLTRRNVVIGLGDIHADLMFVGGGPDELDDEEGKPFVGPPGELLDDFIAAIGMTRLDVFTDNVLGCRPIRITSKKEVKDRDPSKIEVAACIDRLHEAIYAVDPVLIVALGLPAFKALTGLNKTISKARGGVFEAKIPGWATTVTYPVLPTYHTSYLRDHNKQRNKPDSVWEATASDFLLAAELLDQALDIYLS